MFLQLFQIAVSQYHFRRIESNQIESNVSFHHFSLTKNYKHRPKYKKLLEHPFIKKYETMSIDVSVWYASVTKQIENNQLVRQSPQRTSQRFTPPSPRSVKSMNLTVDPLLMMFDCSLRRVTSEPPPIPPRTPESQRKPLLVRLASEPVVEGLDFQTVNGRVTVVGTKSFSLDSPRPPMGNLFSSFLVLLSVMFF